VQLRSHTPAMLGLLLGAELCEDAVYIKAGLLRQTHLLKQARLGVCAPNRGVARATLLILCQLPINPLVHLLALLIEPLSRLLALLIGPLGRLLALLIAPLERLL
jgi:hypothetical protein